MSTSLGAISSVKTWCASTSESVPSGEPGSSVEVLAVLRHDKCRSSAEGRHAHDRHRRDPAGERVRLELAHEADNGGDRRVLAAMNAGEQAEVRPSPPPSPRSTRSSTTASASASKRIVRRSISRRVLPARPRGRVPAAAGPGEVTGGQVRGPGPASAGSSVRADRLLGDRAARVEAAAARHLDRARRIADDAGAVVRRRGARRGTARSSPCV